MNISTSTQVIALSLTGYCLIFAQEPGNVGDKGCCDRLTQKPVHKLNPVNRVLWSAQVNVNDLPHDFSSRLWPSDNFKDDVNKK